MPQNWLAQSSSTIELTFSIDISCDCHLIVQKENSKISKFYYKHFKIDSIAL